MNIIKNNIKKLSLFCFIGLVMASSNACAADSIGTTSHEIDGRNFLLYTPPGITDGTKVPLVLVLHGGLGNAEFIQEVVQLNPVADMFKFYVAYPNGTEGDLDYMKDKRVWNAGICCGIASRKNIDDVAYLESIITELKKNSNIDPEKIFMVGHSNGSMMTYRFACEKPGILAGTVNISGPLLLEECSNDLAGLKVLHIHGEDDNNVPVAGGKGQQSLTQEDYPSVEQTVSKIKDKGAEVVTVILPKTGHRIGEINRSVKKDYSYSLPMFIERFISGNVAQKK